MRILQIVTYISPDGAYGGPVRVAINQAKALTDLGHDVVVAAAAGGFKGPLPAEFDGFPVRLFPAHRTVPKSGFAGITSPSMLIWLVRAVRSADVVHIHLARDLVTLPAAAITLLTHKSLVVQTHGMIDRTDKKLAAPLDRFLTRPILRRARKVLYLTDRERQDLKSVVGEALELVHLPNGVQLPEAMAVERVRGSQTDPEVLYLARLHSRKRPIHFVQAATTLTSRFPNVRFTLVGPDEGEGNAVQSAIQAGIGASRITWTGSIAPEKTIQRMKQSCIYVLPSVDEPFPMSVLEAMSLGIPVIVTDSCGLATPITANEAGVVCSKNAIDISRAIAHLLSDSSLRHDMGTNARRVVEENYSIANVGRKLESIYRAVKEKGEK